MSNVNVIEKDNVEYMYEDTKARDMLGVMQDDTLVAKQAYSVGNLFWYNNKLYRVIQAVASGATMVIDTDCVETDLETELKRLKSELDRILDTTSDDKPYVFRKGKGTLANIKKLVGGTIAWNQLVENGNFASTDGWGEFNATLSVSNNKATITVNSTDADYSVIQIRPFTYIANHVYLFFAKYDATNISNFKQFRISTFNNPSHIFTSNTKKDNAYVISKQLSNTSDGRVQVGCDMTPAAVANDSFTLENVMCIDLTQMFGSTIADAIYALEQATAGAGVAWFRKYFPKAYYAYDAGSLQSVNAKSRKVVGKNGLQIPLSVVSTGIYTVNRNGGEVTSIVANGTPSSQSNFQLVTNITFDKPKILSGCPSGGSTDDYFIYAKDSNNVYYYDYGNGVTLPAGTYSIIQVTTRANVAMSNKAFYPMLRDVSVEDSTFEPYKEYTFDFDSTKQLRGIPKLVDNALQYDGDIYTPDGQITRKYGIVDLGEMTWSKHGSIAGAFYSANLTDFKKVGTGTVLFCESYICAKYTSIYNNAGMDIDKGIYLFRNESYQGEPKERLFIKDTSLDSLSSEDFKTAMSGIYLVYELETPTTESANSYQNPQRAFTDGTEEFIDAGSRDMVIPVGHDTDYDLNVTYPDIEDYADGKTADTAKEIYGVMGENGAKNKWDDTYFSPILQNLNSATYSYSDNVYTINTIAKVGSSRSGCYWQTAKLRDFFGQYVGLGAKLSFDCKGDGNFGARLGIDGSAIVDVTTEYQRYTYSVDDLANIGGIVFYNDDTASGHVIYVKDIMISDARNTNPDFEPYAMTNRELTDLSKKRKVTPTVDGTVLKSMVDAGYVEYDLLTRICNYSFIVRMGTFSHYQTVISGMPKCKKTSSVLSTSTSHNSAPILGFIIPTNATSFTILKVAGASYDEDVDYILTGSYIIADDVVS